LATHVLHEGANSIPETGKISQKFLLHSYKFMFKSLPDFIGAGFFIALQISPLKLVSFYQ
jgi:hypothetical protein